MTEHPPAPTWAPRFPLEAFAERPSHPDLDELVRQTRRLFPQSPVAAAGRLIPGLAEYHAREDDYLTLVLELQDVASTLRDGRTALTLAWYQRDTSQERRFLDDAPAVDRARTLASWAQRGTAEGSALSQAASLMEAAGHLGRAALYHERGGDRDAARALWSRLSASLEGTPTPAVDDVYTAGLCRFNQARMNRATGDAAMARMATVRAVHQLEAAADGFEGLGQRERAFDCFMVLVAMGQLDGTLEHVLEGSLNAIRILREDGLQRHALRHYQQAIDLAEEGSERSAAATLAREMTEYARRQGLRRLVEATSLRQVRLWSRVARDAVVEGHSPRIAENAFLAAIVAAAETDQFATVRQLYTELSRLEVPAGRRSAYAAAIRRTVGLDDAPVQVDGVTLPEAPASPALWVDDIIAWEDAGRAEEVCASVLLDESLVDDRVTRRAALVGRLAALAAGPAPTTDARAAIARALAPVGVYPILPALERLAADPAPAVRVAALESLSRYLFKRSFVPVERALDDGSREVAAAAMGAVEKLHFEHAVDPLVRIHRTARLADGRRAALRSLAQLDGPEAVEVLLGLLEHGADDERQTLLEVMKRGRGRRIVDALKAARASAEGPFRAAIDEVLQARGAPVPR